MARPKKNRVQLSDADVKQYRFDPFCYPTLLVYW